VAEPRDYRQADLFRPALEAIIDMGHPLVRLAGRIDWGYISANWEIGALLLRVRRNRRNARGAGKSAIRRGLYGPSWRRLDLSELYDEVKAREGVPGQAPRNRR
jgi:hypothetical protein